MRHPELNVQFTDEALLRFPSANVGIAVAAPQGLVVPVIARGRAAARWSRSPPRRAELVARAREARLSPSDLEGGTFTISNLGMFGVEQFTAVLNPPQAAILAVGATVEQPGRARGARWSCAPMMTMTLTVDHRAVDGGPAAEFLPTREDVPRGSCACALSCARLDHDRHPARQTGSTSPSCARCCRTPTAGT